MNLDREEYKKTPEGRREFASIYKRRMLYGVLWIVGGVMVGACTNSLVGGKSQGAWDATYFIGAAVALWGIIELVRGYLGFRKYSDD